MYPILIITGHFFSVTIFEKLIYSCKKKSYRSWGQRIIYLGARHQIGYRLGFPTAKLLKSGQNQKILKISAVLGLALQCYLVLATFEANIYCFDNYVQHFTALLFIFIALNSVQKWRRNCKVKVEVLTFIYDPIYMTDFSSFSL